MYSKKILRIYIEEFLVLLLLNIVCVHLNETYQRFNRFIRSCILLTNRA